MIIRQLKQQQYDDLCRALGQNIPVRPWEAGYGVVLTVNGVEYALHLMP